MSVLVAVASSHNSTAEIGERVAERLRTHVAGPVDVVKAASVTAASLEGRDAVVVGSAIHAGSWLGPARQLVHRQRAALAARPVWAFSVGVPPSWQQRDDEERDTDKVLRRDLPALRGHRLFMGRIERTHLPPPVSWFFAWFPKAAGGQGFGDFRDWDAVDSWADDVGKEMAGLLRKE